MFFNEWNNLPPFVKDSSSFLALKNKYVSVCNLLRTQALWRKGRASHRTTHSAWVRGWYVMNNLLS
jgi:hypothetical protein